MTASGTDGILPAFEPGDLSLSEGPRKCVTLTGPESTGKSTLALELARHYKVACAEEYSRQYAERKGFVLDASDVEPIARGQMTVAEMAGATPSRLLIFDSDLVSTVIYANHYYGSCPDWIVEESYRRQSNLYLLCAIDVPWVPDPSRDRGDRREEMYALFTDELARRGAPVVEVKGVWEERFRSAVAAIDALLAT